MTVGNDWWRWALVVVCAALAAVISVQFVRVEGAIGPGKVSLNAGWQLSGDTEIAIPPLGSVHFDTHSAPVLLSARIESVDIGAAQDAAARGESVDTITQSATGDLRGLLWALLIRVLLVAAIAGGIAGALVGRRRLRDAGIGVVAGALAVGLLLGWAWAGFSRDQLRSPRYEGALERAPTVLAAIDREFGSLDRLPGRLRILTDHLTELYSATGLATTSASPDPDEVRVLHISDVHSNPVGLELANSLARSFDVDAIIDTGDLTSFGFPFETRIGERIARISVPYYFIPGNHDTKVNREALDALPNVTLVDGTIIDIAGLRVLGVADPAITANDGDTDTVANAKRAAQAPMVEQSVRRNRPDVLAVSSLQQAQDSIGLVPLIIAGNNHRRSERVEGSTRLLTVGSTGATGIGSFTVKTDLPYEAQVLRFRKNSLVAIDYITFEGIQGNYTIAREVIPMIEKR